MFLSYASQDAEAAKRICDALRTSGVEVWFDAEGGLEHGDEWDAKIRRQIKECVLFIAVISANTQAREEGYFRIEWDLAAERARGIASGVAFILPIVIDDTREPDALVPDRFRSVQWTRLRGGEVTPEVKTRFLKLWSHRTGALKHEAAVGRDLRIPPKSDKVGFGDPALQGKPGWKIYAGLAVAVFALAAGAAWWMLRPGPAPAPASLAGAAPAPIASPARPAREWPKDPELKKAFAIITGLDATIESCRLAEDMINAILKQRPTDPEATTLYAMLNNYYINRGYDASEERQVLARRFSERALQLAPEEPEALAAMAQFISFRGTDYARADTLIRKAMALAPEDPRFARILVYNVLRPTNLSRALAQAKEDAARFPDDALTQYDLALICRTTGDLELMEQALDRTIALAPISSALIWKGWLAAWMHGDLPGFKGWLDRISGNYRFNERAVYMHYLYACLSGDTAHGLEALGAFPGSWLNDFYYNGPRSLLLADLLALAGKPELAQAEYDRALAEIGRMAERDGLGGAWRAEFWALRGAGREADARAAAKRMMQRLNRPYRQPIMQWWHDVIPAQLLAGERADALALIREAAVVPVVRAQIRTALKIDRRMAPFRDDPEIQALLAEPVLNVQVLAPETKGSASIDHKSVAVLAFANLSSDKEQEFFSDGISEELLNVLAKVPGLKVSARTSAFYFKGKQVPMAEIAKQLGVAYVVEGSVQRAGDRVKITAQLIKAADGFHLWSEAYTRDMKDIFAVQDEIAAKIATSLTDKLGMTLPVSAKTTSEAYTLYLQARSTLAKRGVPNLREAVRMFDKVITLDPEYLPARSGLAITLALIPSWSRSLALGESLEMINRAKDEARLVIARQPGNAEAWSALGYMLAIYDWRWQEADEAIARSLALAPNDAEIANFAGDYLRLVVDNPRLIETEGRAVELNPLQSVNHTDLAYAYLGLRQYEQAIEPGRRGRSMAPELLDTNYEALVRAYGPLRRFREMHEVLAAARLIATPQSPVLANMEILAAVFEGRTADGLRLLEEFRPHVEQGGYSPAEYGYHFLRLGQPEKAAHWLRLGAKGHDASLVDPAVVDFDLVAANPVTRVVLEEPGLKELVEVRARNARAAKAAK